MTQSLEIQIIRNAPPIPGKDGRGAKPKYPFADLEVGDAFDVKADPADKTSDSRHKIHNRVTAMTSVKNREARLAGKHTRYSVRYLCDEGVVRVWRVA